jgi:hypothetical protein
MRITQRIKIFIDPILKKKYGPEVCWVFRIIFSCAGVAWEEISESFSECDIAYVSKLGKDSKAKIVVRANFDLWDQHSMLVLERVEREEGVPRLVFRDCSYPSLCLSLSGTCITCQEDLIFDLFWLVSGQHEKRCSMNKHGFLDLSKYECYQSEAIHSAVGSEIIVWLEKIIARACAVTPMHRWPEGRKAALCLTHDVDCPKMNGLLKCLHIMRHCKTTNLRSIWRAIRNNVTYWKFESWVSAEHDLGVRSAFYFCPVQGSIVRYLSGIPDPFYDISGKDFKRLFRFLLDEGCEIGLHASYLAFKSAGRMAGEKRKLEEKCGAKVVGNRHHFWHLNPGDIESSLLLHEKIGLEYDMSLSHERYSGWRRGLCLPYFPFNQRERREIKVLQIPTTWMDSQLFEYCRLDAYQRRDILKSLLDVSAKHGGCFVASIHEYAFDEGLFPDRGESYFWLIRTAMEAGNFWIALPREVSVHWENRYQHIVNASEGLREGV